MRIPRIFSEVSLKNKQLIKLNQHQSNHIINVLRLKIKNKLILFDGSGGEYESIISVINKKEVTAKIIQFININRESKFYIELAQAISTFDKMDLVIQKATEIGVSEISPIITKFCKTKLNPITIEKKISRWKKIAISASEQSGRTIIPKINNPININKFIKNNDRKTLLSEPSSQKPMKELIMKNTNIESLTIIIGPEGGFSTEELLFAKKNNIDSATLGCRILRTETAGITLTSFFIYYHLIK